VSLIAFWGSEERIIAQFGEVLRRSLENGGVYRPEVVDMQNLPPDVPEGGFPPYVCPSPSMTKTAPFAITGEIVRNDESGRYHLRLYLWEMANVRLLYTDEITAENEEECELFLPSALEWLFSWLPEGAAAQSEPLAPEAPLQTAQTVKDYRLHAGIKVGASLRFYYRPADDIFVESDVSHFFNITVGLQASYHFLPFLGVQAEALFTSDYAPYKSYNLQQTSNLGVLSSNNDAFTSYSLMIPLLLKGTLRSGSVFGSALAGLYFVVPLGNMRNSALGGTFNWTVDPPLGYTAGFNVGAKAGPGNLFLDLRWAQDLGATRSNAGQMVYRRSMVSIALGYELGFLDRNK
jgi:hypothetical protein